MDIRDSESSSDGEDIRPHLGYLGGSAGATASSTHSISMAGTVDAAGASLRHSGVSNFSSSPYDGARNNSTSIFANPATYERPGTPALHSSSNLSIFASEQAGPSSSSATATATRPIFINAPASPPTYMGDATLNPAQKTGDDPSMPDPSPPGRHATPTALTRLLAARTLTTSPDISHHASYADGNPNLTRQILPTHHSDAAKPSLNDHLYTRGLLEGKHSDIAVIAFNHRYALHRLILDRAPFFTTALSGPWLEARSQEIVLHPEEIDPTITQKAFELALKRLYGCDILAEEDAEAVGLFATGCWLEIPELVESSVESILRQMDASTLAPLIRLVTHNYYGRAGERVLASAKAMLCRDGWEMPVRYWDEVPGEVVREIVGGDGFYVLGEWERWGLAKRLLDRRLRQKAVEVGLAVQGVRGSVQQAPDHLRRHAFRHPTASGDDVWTNTYGDPDIEPILVLLDCGIHYVHLDFERLQYIRQARDVFGIPVLPEHVITNALWQQMELRQCVVNARENDLELGLSQAADIPAPIATPTVTTETSGKGKQKELSSDDVVPVEDTLEPRPRKFWIPSADCNIVMGGNAEPVITTNASTNYLRLSTGLPAGIDATDVLWASNFAGPSPSRGRMARGSSFAEAEDGNSVPQPRPVAYSNIPPFRFAAEFPNPRGLKEKKRVYSRTVFYAGSCWNIYIQKVRSQKNPQLGVYLHRAKERDPTSSSSDGDGFASDRNQQGTVDERIGLLEREMLLRSSAVGRRSIPTRHSDRGSDEIDDGSMSSYRRRMYGAVTGEVQDTSFTAFESGSEDTDDESPPTLPAPDIGSTNFLDAPEAGGASGPSLSHFPPPNIPSHQQSVKRVPTLPAYTDNRPTIKTYFKIYSPSKGGRLLSVYESAPDKFDYSQSWGWKSSTLMLDEGFGVGGGGGEGAGGVDAKGEGVGKRREGGLRFMVVIGNL